MSYNFKKVSKISIKNDERITSVYFLKLNLWTQCLAAMYFHVLLVHSNWKWCELFVPCATDFSFIKAVLSSVSMQNVCTITPDPESTL